jgi:hypothetical protein
MREIFHESYKSKDQAINRIFDLKKSFDDDFFIILSSGVFWVENVAPFLVSGEIIIFTTQKGKK